MKIAFLSFGFLPKIGGAQVFTYNLMKKLCKRGHDVDLFLPLSTFKKYNQIGNKEEFRVYPIFFNEGIVIKYSPWIISYLLSTWQSIMKYDAWQIILTYPSAYVAKSLHRSVPLFLTAFGDDVQKDANLNYGLRLNSKIENRIVESLYFIDTLVAITQTVKNCYLDLNVNEDKIIEIPMGVDLKAFQVFHDKNLLKKKYKISIDETLILTIGRYHIKKGFEIIPKVAKMLVNRNLKFRWLVVGNGVERLKPSVELSGVEDYVILDNEIGIENVKNKIESMPSESLIALYKSADIFVMTSLLETFGMVLIEAMAAGLPIVSTDCPGCRDIIHDGENGLLSPVNNPKKMADLVQILINDVDLRNKLVENSLKKVKNYDWDKIAKMYERLYKVRFTSFNKPSDESPF